MKSLNFNKLNIQKEDILSKTQMKNILGGYDGMEGCSVTCSEGSYACCSNGGSGVFCDCVLDGVAAICKAGGTKSTSCSLSE